MTQTTNTKPKPRKVRGTGTYMGDEFTFTPYEQGEPTQRNVKTTKGAITNYLLIMTIEFFAPGTLPLTMIKLYSGITFSTTRF